MMRERMLKKKNKKKNMEIATAYQESLNFRKVRILSAKSTIPKIRETTRYVFKNPKIRLIRKLSFPALYLFLRKMELHLLFFFTLGNSFYQIIQRMKVFPPRIYRGKVFIR